MSTRTLDALRKVHERNGWTFTVAEGYVDEDQAKVGREVRRPAAFMATKFQTNATVDMSADDLGRLLKMVNQYEREQDQRR